MSELFEDSVIALLRSYELPADLKEDLRDQDDMRSQIRYLEGKKCTVYEAARLLYLSSDDHSETLAIAEQDKILRKVRERNENS